MKTYANHNAMHEVLDSVDRLREIGLGGIHLSILLVLSRHSSHEKRECFLSHATIAGESMWDRRTVIRAISKLIDHGIIEVIGTHSSRARRYRLVSESHWCQKVTSDSVTIDGDSVTVDGDSVTVDGDSVTVDGDSVTVDGDSKSHEVIKELMNESMKGNNTTAAVGRCNHPDLFSSSGSKKRQKQRHQEGTLSPVTKEEKNQLQPTARSDADSATAAGVSLAETYFDHLDQPHEHRENVQVRWPVIFDRLLGDYQESELKDIIEFAFEEGGTQREWMFRRKGDPVDYFEENIQHLRNKWKSELALKKAKTKSEVTSNTSKTITLNHEVQEQKEFLGL